MATASAVAMKAAPLPAKTPSEVEFERVNAQHREAGERIGTLSHSLTNAEQTLSSATEKYNAACRDLAAGKDADPEVLKGQMSQVSHKIQGLRALLEEAKAQHDPLAKRLTELTLQLENEREEANIEALKRDQIEKGEAANAAEKHAQGLRKLDQDARNAFAAAFKQRQNRLQRLARGL